jgi:membrane protein DedA with SNARE-associated domain
VFEWIVGIVTRLGYTGVAGLTFLENLFPPIPSELILPLAGYVTGSGELAIWPVIAMGTIGSLAGATFWFVVARRIGEARLRAWVDAHGKWITLSGADVDRSKAWFERRGKFAVLIGRMVPGVRTFVSLPAGFTGMTWVPFLLYSSIGTIGWTAALVFAGAQLRHNFAVVSNYIDIVTNILLIVFAVVMARRYVRCWRPGGHQPSTADASTA